MAQWISRDSHFYQTFQGYTCIWLKQFIRLCFIDNADTPIIFLAKMHLDKFRACCIVLLIFILNLEFGLSYAYNWRPDDTQPLSKIALHRMRLAEDSSVSIEASPTLLGIKVNGLKLTAGFFHTVNPCAVYSLHYLSWFACRLCFYYKLVFSTVYPCAI